MSSYESLASVYDEFTEDVDYESWCDYYQRHFTRSAAREVHTVLDLACGTGSASCILAQRGYEVIGVDSSSEMLAEAADKARALGDAAPIFLHQGMEDLDLYGTIDACVCGLDSVNYVKRPALLRRAFARVHLFLMPGGVFIFDVNTPERLASLDGQIFLDEREDAYCVWRAEYAPRRRICTYGIDLFRREPDGRWCRTGEEHEEYAYTLDELEQYLKDAGFQRVRRYGDRKFRAPAADEGRVFFVARKDPKWKMKSYE